MSHINLDSLKNPKALKFLLAEGFNLLFYGIGSKRDLLHQLIKECFSQHSFVIVNGYFQKLSANDILQSIATKLLRIDSQPRSKTKIMHILLEQFKFYSNKQYFLVIHSLDYNTMKSQILNYDLMQLLACENFHLIVTVDKLTNTQVWDVSKLNKFNFISFNASSFKSFDEEVKSPIMISSNHNQQLLFKSLSSIYFSLTSNCQKVLLIIIRKQLECTGHSKITGITFKELYQYCREAFLVSSDLALRTLLVELVDHSILKQHRLNDGTEYLHVPIEKNVITEFLKENDINLKTALD